MESGNGVEAVDLASRLSDPIHLLITDVVLPGGMTGVQVAEQARRTLPNLKTLYTTGYTVNAVVHNGQLDPGVAMVNKPYRRKELLAKIRKILDGEKL